MKIYGTVSSNLYSLQISPDEGVSAIQPAYETPFLIDNSESYQGEFYSGSSVRFGPDFRSDFNSLWRHPLQDRGQVGVAGLVGGGDAGTVYKISLSISGGTNQQYDIGSEKVTSATVVAGTGGTQSFSMYAQYEPTGDGDYPELPEFKIQAEPGGRRPGATVSTRGSSAYSQWSPDRLYEQGDTAIRTLLARPQARTQVDIDRGTEVQVKCPYWTRDYRSLNRNGVAVEAIAHDGTSSSYGISPGGYRSFTRSNVRDDADRPDGDVSALIIYSLEEASFDDLADFWQAVRLQQQLIRAGFNPRWTPTSRFTYTFDVTVVRREGYVLSTQ